MKKKPLNVLIAPLDWGLGHVTRCIPLIQELKQLECHVFVACNHTAQTLLQQEFTHINYLPLAGYNIQYTKYKRHLALKILQQIPKIFFAIRREYKWLQKTTDKYHIDLVFSDNRYGLSIKKVPCIFITHQLQIQAPYHWLEGEIQKINYRFINRFTECWVPDYAGDVNIAGALSHPKRAPKIPMQYINPLSRFTKNTPGSYKYKWLIILSGPEPQRSMLEALLLQAMYSLNETSLLVRGLPESIERAMVSGNCTIVNHLTTSELEMAYAQSEFVISRSGYTTVMEIISLQKKAILIPTPGQTEQEYLAKHLLQQQWCYCFQQDADVLHHLRFAQSFSYQIPHFPQHSLHLFIKAFLSKYGYDATE